MKNGNEHKSVEFMFLFSVFVLEEEVVKGTMDLLSTYSRCFHKWGGGGRRSKIKVILKGCG